MMASCEVIIINSVFGTFVPERTFPANIALAPKAACAQVNGNMPCARNIRLASLNEGASIVPLTVAPELDLAA
jgi:hypothetical protein